MGTGDTGTQYELWVNAERTVLVRRFPDGRMEVALRDDPGEVWSPPIQVDPEDTR